MSTPSGLILDLMLKAWKCQTTKHQNSDGEIHDGGGIYVGDVYGERIPVAPRLKCIVMKNSGCYGQSLVAFSRVSGGNGKDS